MLRGDRISQGHPNAWPAYRLEWQTFGSLHPSFATGPGRVLERIAAGGRLRAFRQAYRDCWQRYQAGERGLLWPYGTYLMRVRHRVRIADP